MPRPGGEADKLGNRYEGLWTVDAALDLIDGEYVDLTVEAVGDEAAGVEFVRTTRSGVREYHSIKRQQGDGNWTLSRLTDAGPTGRSILRDLIAKVGTSSDGVFSSGTSATELEELIERARASDSFEEFKQRVDGSGRLSGQLVKYVAPLCDDERAAWVALQRLCVRTTNEPRLTAVVERRVRSMFRTRDGQPLDARAARGLTEGFLTDNLGKCLTAKPILDYLESRGFVRSRLAGDVTVGERIQQHNRAHVKEVHDRLINRAEIIREESRSAVAALLEHGKSVMLEGMAGSGKSCVLAQLMGRLEEQGVPCLVMRLDRLDGGDQHAQAIGTRLGLPKSPAITLGEFAGGRPSVLVVDQLDALSVVSARNQAVWGAFNELLEEARTYPRMRVLFACRSFDLERDPRLRALADDRERVERIPVGLLDEEVIRSAIAAAELDPAALSERQLRILSIPLHLHLLLESANSGPVKFASAGDLFDAFWEHKAAGVSRQMGGDLSVWTAAVGRLCDELSERETLVAPSLVLDEYGEALNVLASEGVVYVQDGSVRFFHESFFDYAFARTFLRLNNDLVQWLLADEQHLFRRSQVRQVLAFLRSRETDRGHYLKALEGLLSHPRVRFHIKKLVLDWLGALPDPTSDEWDIVEGLEGELSEHAWGVARNSVAWFDALHAMGHLEEWLKSDDEQIERVLTLLRMPEVLEQRSATIAGLVRDFRTKSAEWRTRLRWLVGGGYGYTSPEMHDLVIDLVADGTLDGVRPGVAVNDDWWFMWYGLGTEQPGFAVRLLGAWFDRQLARAAELGREDPFSGNPELVEYSQVSGDLIRECAMAAPLAFVRELFPRLAEFDRSVPKEWIAAPSKHGKPDDQLRDALAEAMSIVAAGDSAGLDAIVDAATYGESKWMCALLLQAWSANAAVYADRVVQFLLERPNRRLDIGYDIAMGEADILAAVSRTAVAAASERCSGESFAELENAILQFTPEWEKRNRAVGRTALALLRALPEERISDGARRRIQELERRFPGAPERGSPRPPDADSGATWTGSPISAADQRLMRDEQWLTAMAKYRSAEEDAARGGTIVGGASEFSRGLEALAREHPERFAALANRMDASLHSLYFEAILRGLTHGEGSDRPGTLDQVCGVLRRITDIGVGVSEKVLADAVGALADEDVPEDIVRVLCGVAENATDPDADRWLDISDRNPERDPIAQAINSARGRAAEALASLLFADQDRWHTLRPTVEQLIVDPVLAVRSVAVNCLLAILDTHRDEALAGFETLAAGADSILGSNFIERFVHYAMFRDYAAMRPTLLKTLQSSEPPAVKVGARQMALAGLSIEEARNDTNVVLGMGEDARAAAANIYADNVSDATVGPECEERLKALFQDESEAVRRAAARCWNTLKPDELAKRGSLLGAFVNSIGPDIDVRLLIHTLEQSHERLPSEVCELAERVVEAYGPKGADPRLREAGAAYRLAPLIIRLHEETEDRVFRGRVLDVIDDMLRVGFMRMGDELERYDR